MDRINFLLRLALVLMVCGAGHEAWAADPTEVGCYRVNRSTGAYEGSDTNHESGATQTEDQAAAKIRVGNIHLMDTDIQPVGSILAYASVPPTEYKVYNAGPTTLLWACKDGTDLSKIRFMSSVNGDDRVGGRWEVTDSSVTQVASPNNAGGQQNVFYTWFKGVGIRQKMDGITLGRSWTILPTPPVFENGTATWTGNASQDRDKCRSGWKCIRLKDVPVLQFELIRVAGLPPASGDQSTYCNGTTRVGSTVGVSESGNYNCLQPSSYISLGHTGPHPDGNGDVGDSLVRTGHNLEGEVHGTSLSTFYFWGDDNGFGYTLWNAAKLFNETTAACQVQTPLTNINFGTMTTSELEKNGSSSQDFWIDIDCKDGVNSGITSNTVAVGVQVSQGAYDAAKTLTALNLLDNTPVTVGGQSVPANGVKALLSNDYLTNNSRPKNVGIYLKYQNTANYINFVGQPGATGTLPVSNSGRANNCSTNADPTSGTGVCYPAVVYPQGNAAGWFPVLAQAKDTQIIPKAGFKRYRIPYTAVMKKLEGVSGAVTAGDLKSTAYVVVKIQ